MDVNKFTVFNTREDKPTHDKVADIFEKFFASIVKQTVRERNEEGCILEAVIEYDYECFAKKDNSKSIIVIEKYKDLVKEIAKQNIQIPEPGENVYLSEEELAHFRAVDRCWLCDYCFSKMDFAGYLKAVQFRKFPKLLKDHNYINTCMENVRKYRNCLSHTEVEAFNTQKAYKSLTDCVKINWDFFSKQWKSCTDCDISDLTDNFVRKLSAAYSVMKLVHEKKRVLPEEHKIVNVEDLFFYKFFFTGRVLLNHSLEDDEWRFATRLRAEQCKIYLYKEDLRSYQADQALRPDVTLGQEISSPVIKAMRDGNVECLNNDGLTTEDCLCELIRGTQEDCFAVFVESEDFSLAQKLWQCISQTQDANGRFLVLRIIAKDQAEVFHFGHNMRPQETEKTVSTSNQAWPQLFTEHELTSTNGAIQATSLQTEVSEEDDRPGNKSNWKMDYVTDINLSPKRTTERESDVGLTQRRISEMAADVNSPSKKTIELVADVTLPKKKIAERVPDTTKTLLDLWIPEVDDTIFLTKSGKKIRDDRLISNLAGGGEGLIYALEKKSSMVAKIYKPDMLSVERQKKIRDMIDIDIEDPDGHWICWPQMLVLDDEKDGQIVGYTMRKVTEDHIKGFGKGYTVEEILSFLLKDSEQTPEDLPCKTREDLVTLCFKISVAFDKLHRNRNGHEILMGDVNPKNIMARLEREEIQVYLIDTDSYQIDDMLCEVGQGDYTSPRMYRESTRNPEGMYKQKRELTDEYFSAAVLYFYILMLKEYPFMTNQQQPNLADSIKNGYFDYDQLNLQGNENARSRHNEMWQNLTGDVKENFKKVFHDQKIVTDQDWIEAFRGMLDVMKDEKKTLSWELFPTCHLDPDFENDMFIPETCIACKKPVLTTSKIKEGLGTKPLKCNDCLISEKIKKSIVYRARCKKCGQYFTINAYYGKNIKDLDNCTCYDCKPSSGSDGRKKENIEHDIRYAIKNSMERSL